MAFMEHAIDSRQLRAFICLARSGSFTQAGRELHLTQSAISHAIKSLENDLARSFSTARARACTSRMPAVSCCRTRRTSCKA
jgi:hypothetical protein